MTDPHEDLVEALVEAKPWVDSIFDRTKVGSLAELKVRSVADKIDAALALVRKGV